MVIALVLIVATAATGLYLAASIPPPAGPYHTVSDGPTLYQAASLVILSVARQGGGPWALFSIYGIAAQAPFSANVLGYSFETNRTVNACGSQFDGLTLWNGSMPIFTGTFNSGTAPFWQFAFYSNVTDQILLATDVQGVPHVFPPMPVQGSCYPWYDLGNPEVWVQALSNFPVDSPLQAETSWRVVDQGLINRNLPTVEIFTSGPNVFTGLGDAKSVVGVYFERGGIVGISNVQPVIQVAEDPNASSSSVYNGSANCAVLNYPYFGPTLGFGRYNLSFTAPALSTFSSTTQVAASFQAVIEQNNTSVPASFDGWGLASWMVSISLTNASGRELAVAGSECPTWVTSVATCRANQSGWYVVLQSQSGEWLASYGLSPNGSGWSVPVTALVSHQQLLVVVPGTWAESGMVVAVASTVPYSDIGGSFDL